MKLDIDKFQALQDILEELATNKVDNWEDIQTEDVEKIFKLYKESEAEDKNYIFFLIFLKIQQILIEKKEWKKSELLYKVISRERMEHVINDDNDELPGLEIINILIHSKIYTSQKIELDQVIYKALLKVFSSDVKYIENVSIYGGRVEYEKGKRIEFSLSGEDLIMAGLSCCNQINIEETQVALNYFLKIVSIMASVIEVFSIEEDKVKEIFSVFDNIINRFDMNLLKNVSKFYKEYSQEMPVEWEEYVPENKQFESAFWNLIEGIKFEEYRLVGEGLLNEILKLFLSYVMCSEEEKSNELFVRIRSFISQKDIPKYKKNLIEKVILAEEYIDILFENQLYKDVANIYLQHDNKKNLKYYYFKIAYSLNKYNYVEEAKYLYNELLNIDPTSAVYNNLGAIYENRDELETAKEYYIKALELDKESELYNRNFNRVEESIKKNKEKEKELKNIYFKRVESYEKSILFAIYKLSINQKVTVDKLQEVLGKTKQYIFSRVNKLIDLEMLCERNGYLYIQPIIREVIAAYIDPKVERQVIKVDNTRFYRPIFYHESELMMYRVLQELFPQHFIFPNISLKTIFEIEKLKPVLDKELLEYLYMAHVDFAIINTTNYFPILTFEKDSEYNDSDYGKLLMKRKNEIFRIGGIPLIRVRFNSGIDYEKLKAEIREATKSLILEYQEEVSVGGINFSKEIDIKRFGIVESPIDLEKVSKAWKEIVGEAIFQKTHIIDIEDGVLQVEIAKEIESIIKLGEVGIKEKIIAKFPVIKEISFKIY